MFLSSKIPLDQILEFTFLELEPTSFYQSLKLCNLDLLGLLMLDPVEESLKKHVVLLFVCELHGMLGIEGSHQLAELLLIDFVVPLGVAFEVTQEGIVESLFGLLVIFVEDWSLEQVLHERSDIDHSDVVISFKVEEEGSEDL